MRYKGILSTRTKPCLTSDRASASPPARAAAPGDRGRRRAEAYHAINDALWRDLEKGLTTQAQLKVRRFEQLMERYGVSGDPAEAAEFYVEALSEQSILLPGALEAVERIAKKLPVSIVTNGISRVQRAAWPGAHPHLIKGFVISEEIGIAKPDPRVLEIAMEQLVCAEARR
jgi:FMN phosphatase YigB (HAD superfamily)